MTIERHVRRTAVALGCAVLVATPAFAHAQAEARGAPERPFGTLREQAAEQQRWLDDRMANVLPALMRKHGVEMWVVPMREYNEDPIFSSIVSPTTLAARRRTIYVFFDECVQS